MRINLSGIVGLIVIIILSIIAFSIMKYVYIFLLFALPITLAITFFVKRSLLIGYFKGLWFRITQRGLSGVLGTVISLFFLPFRALLLMGQAFLFKKIGFNEDEFSPNGDGGQNKQQSEFTEFEDLSNEFKVLDNKENT
jgi:hypothetical protein